MFIDRMACMKSDFFGDHIRDTSFQTSDMQTIQEKLDKIANRRTFSSPRTDGKKKKGEKSFAKGRSSMGIEGDFNRRSFGESIQEAGNSWSSSVGLSQMSPNSTDTAYFERQQRNSSSVQNFTESEDSFDVTFDGSENSLLTSNVMIDDVIEDSEASASDDSDDSSGSGSAVPIDYRFKIWLPTEIIESHRKWPSTVHNERLLVTGPSTARFFELIYKPRSKYGNMIYHWSNSFASNASPFQRLNMIEVVKGMGIIVIASQNNDISIWRILDESNDDSSRMGKFNLQAICRIVNHKLERSISSSRTATDVPPLSGISISNGINSHTSQTCKLTIIDYIGGISVWDLSQDLGYGLNVEDMFT